MFAVIIGRSVVEYYSMSTERDRAQKLYTNRTITKFQAWIITARRRERIYRESDCIVGPNHCLLNYSWTRETYVPWIDDPHCTWTSSNTTTVRTTVKARAANSTALHALLELMKDSVLTPSVTHVGQEKCESRMPSSKASLSAPGESGGNGGRTGYRDLTLVVSLLCEDDQTRIRGFMLGTCCNAAYMNYKKDQEKDLLWMPRWMKPLGSTLSDRAAPAQPQN
ncbi:hypothetical protein EI94DRAFT_1708259 [Lactarius quietus]|nr:hypothetical protein EI94DRAFT_1708259 [Lactarius quietus]